MTTQTFFSGFITLCLAAMSLCCSSDKTEWSTNSPSGTYASLVLTEGHLWAASTATVVTIKSRDSVLLDKKVIHTGDSFDADFANIYPNVEWLSDSVLHFGRASAARSDLKVVNSSSKTIRYLLVESGDKTLMMRVSPGEAKTVKVALGDTLSIEGDFGDDSDGFRSAIRPANKPEDFKTLQELTATVFSDHAKISAGDFPIQPARCCGSDRPSQ